MYYLPCPLVWDSRFCASFPFDLGWKGHTWRVSCRWLRGQSPLGTLERCLFAAFPGVWKPISASPPASLPIRKKHCTLWFLLKTKFLCWLYISCKILVLFSFTTSFQNNPLSNYWWKVFSFLAFSSFLYSGITDDNQLQDSFKNLTCKKDLKC